MDNKRLSVDPTSYTSLLQLIARAESNDNYNAYFGSPNNSTIKFTEMTISDVLAWQADFVQQGNASSAVGRYQIIDTTLSELVQQLGIDTKHKFDQDMQDRLAIALLERQGAEEYINKELKRENLLQTSPWSGQHCQRLRAQTLPRATMTEMVSIKPALGYLTYCAQ